MDVARRVRDGHPWIFSEALQGRTITFTQGQDVEVEDAQGGFVARAVADPGGKPLLRVFSQNRHGVLDSAQIHRIVARCLKLRRQMLHPSPTSCYRLLNGDSEGIPAVTVDRYASHLVVTLFSPVVLTYLDALLDALEALNNPDSVYLQRRYTAPDPGQPRPGAELVRGEHAPPDVVVTEGKARFVVDVSAPSGTGLFPDMRLGRRAVARIAAGRRVLNCFSYTGAFSALAALSGAAAVTSVDTSSRSHGRARRNFSENGLDPSDRAYTFITGDALATMSRLSQRNERFDLVILDPPTFAAGKGRPFAATKDYAELVTSALEVLEVGGQMCVACNATRLTTQDLERAVARGASMVRRDVLVTARLGQPPDYPAKPGFPEGRYLKFFVIQAN